MPIIKVNAIDIYYEEYGNGYPLILISGLGGSSINWQTVRNVLSKHYRVIVFDNRGAGRSSAPSEAYSISQMAVDMTNLFNYLGIKRAHVLGHSMGGFIAQEFALMYPEKTDKLMLCCTMDKLSKRNKLLFESMYSLWKSGISRESWFRGLYCWFFSPSFFEDEQTIKFIMEFAITAPHQQTLSGFKGQMEACIGFNVTEKIKNIQHETLVLVGEDDILITPNESKLLKDSIPNSRIVVVPGAGHTPHVECKNDFLKKILDFLQ